MKLFNTLSQKIEEFFPLLEGRVKIYVCGITPYDTTHLGHAFVYTQFDALIRYLRFKGFSVNYVQNVTDVDDDILKRSKREKRDWRELGEYWTERFVSDMKALNILPPDDLVKATDAIPKIIETVSKLLSKGNGYISGGNIYFDIKSFPKFGTLSKYSRQEMIKLSKQRGADPDDPNKRNPLDFILWQTSAAGEPLWEAPFGKGRPGWHIECSSIIDQNLGPQIDIHGGGNDLIFPHHEAELAQEESLTGKSPFVKVWMHVGTLHFQGEKMSKSLANLVMVSDFLKKYSANSIRYLLLSHHYRKEWEFDESELIKIQKGFGLKVRSDLKKFDNAMENDFNIPEALKYADLKTLKILGFTFED